MPKMAKGDKVRRSELPDTLKRSGAKAQRTFAKTHDAAVEQYGEGERAHRTALASLKHTHEKRGGSLGAEGQAGPERSAFREDDGAEAARRRGDLRRRRRRAEHEGRAVRARPPAGRRGPLEDVEDASSRARSRRSSSRARRRHRSERQRRHEPPARAVGGRRDRGDRRDRPASPDPQLPRDRVADGEHRARRPRAALPGSGLRGSPRLGDPAVARSRSAPAHERRTAASGSSARPPKQAVPGARLRVLGRRLFAGTEGRGGRRELADRGDADELLRAAQGGGRSAARSLPGRASGDARRPAPSGPDLQAQLRRGAAALLPRAALPAHALPAAARWPWFPTSAGSSFQAVHTRDVAEAYRLAVVGDARGAFNVAAEPVLDRADTRQCARRPPRPGTGGAGADGDDHELATASAADAARLARHGPQRSRSWTRPAHATELGWEPSHSSLDAIRDVLSGIADAEGEPTPPLETARQLTAGSTIAACPRRRIVWAPSAERIASATITRYREWLNETRGLALEDYAGAVAVVGRRARGVLGLDLGVLRGRGERAVRARAHHARDARRRLVPRRAAQLRGARLPRPRRRRRRDPPRLGAAAAGRVDVGRAAGARRRRRRRAARSGRRGRRPRRRLPPEHPRDDRRLPRLREHRRDLVELRAGVRRPQRGRPLRPDRAEGAAHGRRLSLRRQGLRPERGDRGARARAADAAVGRSFSPTWPAATGSCPPPSSSSPNCRSTTRSGCSTAPAPPACRRRSSTARAGSCSST